MEKELWFTNNDIYIIEIVNDKVVLNNNYNGMIIYDAFFNEKTDIKFAEDVNIYSVFKSGKEVLLYCPDDRLVIYINVETYISFHIDLDELCDKYTFSNCYRWQDDNVVLKDNSNCCIVIDLKKRSIKVTDVSTINNILKEIPLFIEKQDDVIESCFHEVEYGQNAVAYVGENRIKIDMGSKSSILYPFEGMFFSHLRFAEIFGKTYVYILTKSKSDNEVSMVNQIELSQIMEG